MINKNQNEEFKSKENCCSSVSTYLIKNYPDIPLQKFDSYATAKEAFENGTSVAWANDNTEVIAFSLQNKGYTVGIPSLGSNDSIAPAVTKGKDTYGPEEEESSYMNWEFIVEYLPLYEKATVLTVRIGLLGIAFAILVGFACAMVQYHRIPVVRQIVAVYIELSRNTPLLVQLFFIYCCRYLF